MFKTFILLFFILLTSNSFSMKLKEGDRFSCTGLYEKLLNFSNESTDGTTLYYKDMNTKKVYINILKDNILEFTTRYGKFKTKFKRNKLDDNKYFGKSGGQIFVFSKETIDNLSSYKKNGHYILFAYPSIPFENMGSSIISIFKHKCFKASNN